MVIKKSNAVKLVCIKEEHVLKISPSFVVFFFFYLFLVFFLTLLLYVNCIRIVCITCLLLYGRVSLHEYEEHKGCKWTLLNKEIKKKTYVALPFSLSSSVDKFHLLTISKISTCVRATSFFQAFLKDISVNQDKRQQCGNNP